MLDRNKKLLLYMDNSMPKELRMHAKDAMQCALAKTPELLTSVNSKKEGMKHHGPCIHMCFYNRMYTDGADAPTDIDPYIMRCYRDGSVIRTNYAQITPVESKEMRATKVLYLEVMDALASVFAFLRDSVGIECILRHLFANSAL